MGKKVWEGAEAKEEQKVAAESYRDCEERPVVDDQTGLWRHEAKAALPEMERARRFLPEQGEGSFWADDASKERRHRES